MNKHCRWILCCQLEQSGVQGAPRGNEPQREGVVLFVDSGDREIIRLNDLCDLDEK